MSCDCHIVASYIIDSLVIQNIYGTQLQLCIILIKQILGDKGKINSLKFLVCIESLPPVLIPRLNRNGVDNLLVILQGDPSEGNIHSNKSLGSLVKF